MPSSLLNSVEPRRHQLPRRAIAPESSAGFADAMLAKTQADQAYYIIRADILACRLRPGAKVRINELRDTLAVSLGSIREALSRLGADGWVIAEPQKGYRVTPVSLDDLRHLTKARLEIETLCLADALEHGDMAWESGLLATFHVLRHLPERDRSDRARLDDGWASAHDDFHEAIVAACANPWLLRMRRMLFAQSERYRRLSVPLRSEERDVNHEHHEIVVAALARDKDRAASLLARHFEATSAIIATSFDDDAPAG